MEHDPAALQNWQRRLGAAGLRRVIDTLVADAPRLARQLRESAARGDAPVLQRTAHSMKTPSGMFGANELMQLCQQLEDRAASGSVEGAGPSADDIGRRFEQLAQELAALAAAPVQHI